MAGKRCKKKYAESVKNEVRKKHEKGYSVNSLSKEYEISR